MQTDISQLTALPPRSTPLRAAVERNADGSAVDPARRTAEKFEAFFLTRMLDEISSGLETDGPFGGGHGEKVFRGMLNEQYAETITRTGGLGIADSVYREILAIQERSRI